MKINLKDINIAYMTSTKYPQRDKDTSNLLDQLGLTYKRCDGGITTPYTIGVARGHIQGLASFQPPTLLLEDDIRITKYYSEILNVPDDADAIYLGNSLYGRVNKTTLFKSVEYTSATETCNRLHNMLSMHAIVYITECYTNFVMNHLVHFIDSPKGGVDDTIADSMNQFNIYGYKYPMFYQNDGHSNEATLIALL